MQQKNRSMQKEMKETVEVANIYQDAILGSFYSLCTQFISPTSHANNNCPLRIVG